MDIILTLYPFQRLCTECGQSLTETEMKVTNFESVSKRMPILMKQLEVVQVCSRLAVHSFSPVYFYKHLFMHHLTVYLNLFWVPHFLTSVTIGL